MNKSLAKIMYSAPILPAIEVVTDRFQTALLRFYKDPAAVKVIEAAFREQT